MSIFYLEKPDNFDKELEVSTVFMEHEKRILLLQRSSCTLAWETWGVPGGKLEKGETPIEGLIREIKEELSLDPHPSELRFVRSVYVRHPRVKYQLHLFQWLLSTCPLISLNPQEHQDYKWQPIEAFNDLPLLEGQLEAFKCVYL